MGNLVALKQELLKQKSAIEEKGGKVNVANINPSPFEITEGIRNLEAVQLSSANATENDVAVGKTFYSTSGGLKTGTYKYDLDCVRRMVFKSYEGSTQDRKTFEFPSGGTIIRTGLFQTYPYQADVYLNEEVEEVEESAFCDAKYLRVKNLSEMKNLKSVKSYAFKMTDMEDNMANLPDTIEYVGREGFGGCLKDGMDLKLPKNLISANYGAFGSYYNSAVHAKNFICDVDNLLTFGHGMLTYLCFDCDLVIPPTVNTIDIDCCFGGSFNNVVIHQGVTYVGDRAFGGPELDSLENYHTKTFTFESVTPPFFGEEVFATQLMENGFKIYVPDNALETYKAVPNLAQYVNYIFPISQKE